MQPALGRSNAGAVLAWLEKYKHHADPSLLRNSHGECAYRTANDSRKKQQKRQ